MLDTVLPVLLRYHRHAARLRHATAWLAALRLAVEFDPSARADSVAYLQQLLHVGSSTTYVEAEVAALATAWTPFDLQ